MSLLSGIHARRSKISDIKLFWTPNKFTRFHGYERVEIFGVGGGRCLSRDIKINICPFYLVSTPGEVKYPIQNCFGLPIHCIGNKFMHALYNTRCLSSDIKISIMSLLSGIKGRNKIYHDIKLLWTPNKLNS